MKYKVIVFDFDDTLVVSGKIKIDSYFEVFKQYPIEKSIIQDILNDFPELNRYDTISRIIKQSNLDIDSLLLSQEYSSLVQNKIENANSLEYAETILNRLLELNVDMYLSSNTPLNILTQIIYTKKWQKYFVSLFGFPSNKEISLKEIILKTGYTLDKYLVVGDGESDRISASINMVDFYKVDSFSLEGLKKLLKL